MPFPDATTESGRSLQGLAQARPVLLIFLRHWGCPFCRQTLSEVAAARRQIEDLPCQPVFVHMGTPERARPYFEHYGLRDVERISDPSQALYRAQAFQLPLRSLFLHLLDRSVMASVLRGLTLRHGMEFLPREDRKQMPGIFLLYRNQVLRCFHYRSIADQPDLLKLARLPVAEKTLPGPFAPPPEALA